MSIEISRILKKEWGIADYAYTEISESFSHKFYLDWLEKKHHGPLKYLEGEKGQKRKDLKLYFPEFKSGLVFMFSYAKEKQQLDLFYKLRKITGPKIASYVFAFNGKDYHHHIKEVLDQISNQLKQSLPSLKTSLTVDIHPVLERDLAVRSGLGWFGKNSMFISKSEGSFVLLASLLLSETLPLEKIVQDTDHCGQCLACIDSCPTNAIDINTRTIMADKCISTYTIELFKDDEKPPLGFPFKTGEIFGCDICQDVCPWNKRHFIKNPLNENEIDGEFSNKILNFFLKRSFLEIYNDLLKISSREYKRIFKSTSLERTGRVGMLKNVKFYLNSK